MGVQTRRKTGDTFKTIFVDKHLYNVRGKEGRRKRKGKGGGEKGQTSVEDYSA